jgi:hypothetical protein
VGTIQGKLLLRMPVEKCNSGETDEELWITYNQQSGCRRGIDKGFAKVKDSKLWRTKKQGLYVFQDAHLYVCFYNLRSDDVRDYENLLKISMLYHARLNVEY